MSLSLHQWLGHAFNNVSLSSVLLFREACSGEVNGSGSINFVFRPVSLYRVGVPQLAAAVSEGGGLGLCLIFKPILAHLRLK